jgi:hypothetical protein
MKKNLKITLFSAILLMLAGGMVSCEKNPNEKPFDVPKNVFFTEFELSANCRWANVEEGILVVINSEEELRKHIVGAGPLSTPCNSDISIDFSKHTLLLARGSALQHIYNTSNDFQRLSPILLQLSPSRYKLNIEVKSSNEEVQPPWEWGWTLALLVDKIEDKSKVELNVRTLLDDEIWSVEHDESASIVGKWQLVRTIAVFTARGPIMLDVSPHNIGYEFKSNGILTVSGNQSIGPESGGHSYSIVDNDEGVGLWISLPALKIGDRHYEYKISSEKLEFNDAYMDGSIYRLVKINN